MIDEIRIETLEDAVENETAQTENEREENGCALTTPAMIALIEFIAKSLVDAPECVRVIEKESDETSVTLELSVAQDDMGKVIGKQGRIAKAIRTVARAASVKSDKKYKLEIV